MRCLRVATQKYPCAMMVVPKDPSLSFVNIKCFKKKALSSLQNIRFLSQKKFQTIDQYHILKIKKVNKKQKWKDVYKMCRQINY